MIKLLLFLFLPLSASQGYRYIHAPMPLIRDIMKPADREEYYCLLDACKCIRRMHISICDVRMSIDDAIEAGITLYLKNVNTLAALVLLKDLQNKEFRMD